MAFFTVLSADGRVLYATKAAKQQEKRHHRNAAEKTIYNPKKLNNQTFYLPSIVSKFNFS